MIREGPQMIREAPFTDWLQTLFVIIMVLVW